jgi:hypothetical protein
VTAGTCRFCRCTEDDPCRIPGGDSCSWYVATRDVCTAPGCITAYHAELRRKMSRNKRRTPAEIHALMKEEKNAKQRAYRAKRKQQRGAA